MVKLYNILVVESNYAERARILKKFQEHQLRHTFHFASNAKDALVDLYYFNKEMKEVFPQVLFINYNQENLELLEKINTDSRYSEIKVFLLIDNDLSYYKEKVSKYKIHGIVKRSLDFKKFSDETYLDTIDLYLHLLRVSIDKNNRVKHLLNPKNK